MGHGFPAHLPHHLAQGHKLAVSIGRSKTFDCPKDELGITTPQLLILGRVRYISSSTSMTVCCYESEISKTLTKYNWNLQVIPLISVKIMNQNLLKSCLEKFDQNAVALVCLLLLSRQGVIFSLLLNPITMLHFCPLVNWSCDPISSADVSMQCFR